MGVDFQLKHSSGRAGSRISHPQRWILFTQPSLWGKSLLNSRFVDSRIFVDTLQDSDRIGEEITGKQESRNQTFLLVYFCFSELSQNIISRPTIKISSLPVPAMSTSIEAQIIQLHLRHFTQDQITAALRTGKPRVSRCIRDFWQTGITPKARRIGRLRKRPYPFGPKPIGWPSGGDGSNCAVLAWGTDGAQCAEQRKEERRSKWCANRPLKRRNNDLRMKKSS
jgi:hypothetical protein